MNKLSVNALGVGVGAMWAVSIFFFGIAAMFGWGEALVRSWASLYIGFGASFIGAVIGAVWAFVDGYVGGVIIAWVYNRLAR